MLKLPYFGHLSGRAESVEKTPMLRNGRGQEKKGRQRVRWLFTDSTDLSLSNLLEMVKDGEAWCVAVRGVAKSWT